MNWKDAMLVDEGETLRLNKLPKSSAGLELGGNYTAIKVYNHGNKKIKFGILDSSAVNRVLPARYFSRTIAGLSPDETISSHV
jgi:hypothetical protein